MDTNKNLQQASFECKSLGELMYKLRSDLQIGQKEFGAIFGISASQVSRYETEIGFAMRPEIANRFCDAFNIPWLTYTELVCQKKQTKLELMLGENSAFRPSQKNMPEDIIKTLYSYAENLKATGVKNLEFTINDVQILININS